MRRGILLRANFTIIRNARGGRVGKREGNMQTLDNISCGKSAVVMAVDTGVRARTRLESLGLLPGSEVSVLSNGKGPMILSVGEGRLVVERNVAKQVMVA